MGFRDAKRRVIQALKGSVFQHAVRGEIDEKDLLHSGVVTKEEVLEIVKMCNGTHHTETPHHLDGSIVVHVLKRDGWYIKFYFVDTNAFFISVHK
ncbi:MAG TPA: hypothetical protein QGF63_05485 [Alphaproteobacteria bacterium]|jgi:hypothetical protein|nr:hypothetical protein [Alphaproteobacteria bacterium]